MSSVLRHLEALEPEMGGVGSIVVDIVDRLAAYQEILRERTDAAVLSTMIVSVGAVLNELVKERKKNVATVQRLRQMEEDLESRQQKFDDQLVKKLDQLLHEQGKGSGGRYGERDDSGVDLVSGEERFEKRIEVPKRHPPTNHEREGLRAEKRQKTVSETGAAKTIWQSEIQNLRSALEAVEPDDKNTRECGVQRVALCHALGDNDKGLTNFWEYVSKKEEKGGGWCCLATLVERGPKRSRKLRDDESCSICRHGAGVWCVRIRHEEGRVVFKLSEVGKVD